MAVTANFAQRFNQQKTNKNGANAGNQCDRTTFKGGDNVLVCRHGDDNRDIHCIPETYSLFCRL
ncbi:Uncharacterised protein [Klebsiella pneumoniae]|nr:Uncharacterised protein [Klebsiella pneumoniae]